VDLTHDVPPFDIERRDGSWRDGAHFPAGTVFVTVVDPGVGSERKAIAARTKLGHVFVGPDNGVFTRVLEAEGAEEVRELAQARYFREGRMSSTFHGRRTSSRRRRLDSGRHAALPARPGARSLGDLAPPPAQSRTASSRAKWSSSRLPYGNVITNITAAQLEEAGGPAGRRLKSGPRHPEGDLALPPHFQRRPLARPLALLSSRGFLSFSINQRRFREVRARLPRPARRLRKKPSKIWLFRASRAPSPVTKVALTLATSSSTLIKL